MSLITLNNGTTFEAGCGTGMLEAALATGRCSGMAAAPAAARRMCADCARRLLADNGLPPKNFHFDAFVSSN